MGYTRTTRLDESNTISENSLWNFTKAELMEYYTIDLQPMIANCFHKDGMPVEYNNVYKSYTKEAIIEGIVKIQDLILKYQKPEAKPEVADTGTNPEIVPKHYSDIVRQLRETQVNLDSIDDDEVYDTSELIAERDALQALLDDGDYIEFNDYE